MGDDLARQHAAAEGWPIEQELQTKLSLKDGKAFLDVSSGSSVDFK